MGFCNGVLENMEVKLYARRWFLLGLFVLFTSNFSMHWFQFVIITNIVVRYYSVSPTLVEWTSIIVMAMRAFFLFPALFLIDKLETKNTLVMASALCFVGSSIKTFSVSPDKFYLAMSGQVFCAVSLIFTYSLIGRFSAAWFSSSEISRAGALCCIGETIGAAFAYLLPTKLVPDTENLDEVGKGLQQMHYIYTTWALLILILVIIFFKSKPKLPPSAAQAYNRSSNDRQVYSMVKKLLTNSNFVLFVLSQGLFFGSGSNAVGTLLNEMIVTNFSNSTEHAGAIAFLNLLSGIVGSVILGFIQDKTRKFKCIAVTLSVANCIGMALFTTALKMGNIIYVYITYGIYGFLMQGYYATTIQMGIELSFPIPEGITVAITSVCVELVSMIAASLYGLAMKNYGYLKSNTCVIIVLIVSTITVCLVPPKFKREELELAAKSSVEKELLPESETSATQERPMIEIS